MPSLTEQFLRDPLEVAFVCQPYPPGPIIGRAYHFAIDILLLLFSIISGIGLLKRQRWAWYSAMSLFVLVVFVHIAANTAVGQDATGKGFIGTFDSSYGLSASVAINLAAFYLLSRRDKALSTQ